MRFEVCFGGASDSRLAVFIDLKEECLFNTSGGQHDVKVLFQIVSVDIQGAVTNDPRSLEFKSAQTEVAWKNFSVVIVNVPLYLIS